MGVKCNLGYFTEPGSLHRALFPTKEALSFRWAFFPGYNFGSQGKADIILNTQPSAVVQCAISSMVGKESRNHLRVMRTKEDLGSSSKHEGDKEKSCTVRQGGEEYENG